MTYKLVLLEPKVEGREKAVGENVFLDNLDYDYKVYLFYYPGAMPNDELEEKLRTLGNITGNNLFLNIGQLNDRKFDMIREKFKIQTTPVIIITGIDGIASLKENSSLSTAYVRLDNEDLLKSVNKTIKCVQTIYYSFIGGDIVEALKLAKEYNRDSTISLIKGKLADSLIAVGYYFEQRDIEVSIDSFKFAIKKSQVGT